MWINFFKIFLNKINKNRVLLNIRTNYLYTLPEDQPHYRQQLQIFDVWKKQDNDWVPCRLHHDGFIYEFRTNSMYRGGG